MKKFTRSLLLVFLMLVFSSSTAFPWGSAVHAYMADHIGKIFGLRNQNEMYGSMAADTFNLMYDPEVFKYRKYLYEETHIHFMKVWYAASWWGYEKSLAYGVVCHNRVWGADYLGGLFSADYPPEFVEVPGYVTDKATQLREILSPLLDDLPINDFQKLQICENLIETAVDILVKRLDPCIGLKVITSALFRSGHFPDLLVQAYANDFKNSFDISYYEAKNIIIAAEDDFRSLMILYGQALMQNEETAVDLLAGEFVNLAQAAYGIIVDKDTVIYGLNSAITICESDFEDAIEYAIRKLKLQMFWHWIFYF
jgi:hypothetical protein